MSVLVIDGAEYHLRRPRKEEELEGFVKGQYRDIFGKDSLYFDMKPKLRSEAGIGSKPDGIVIVFDPPSYYVIENERAEHGIHDHIVTQISKFNTAFKSLKTRKIITSAIYDEIKGNKVTWGFAKSKTGDELFKFLTDLFSGAPVIVIIIDEVSDELNDAVSELPMKAQVIEFKTYVKEDNPSVHAHTFNPIVPSAKEPEEPIPGKKKRLLEHYQDWNKRLAWVTEDTRNLVNALSDRILQFEDVSSKIHGRNLCFYKGKPSTKSTFAAFILTHKALHVRIRTDPATFEDLQKWTGDKIYKGWFFKEGQEREFKVTNRGQIGYATRLLQQSYATTIQGESSKDSILKSYARSLQEKKGLEIRFRWAGHRKHHILAQLSNDSKDPLTISKIWFGTVAGEENLQLNEIVLKPMETTEIYIPTAWASGIEYKITVVTKEGESFSKAEVAPYRATPR